MAKIIIIYDLNAKMEMVVIIWGIIKCAQEKIKTVLMNFLTVLMDL